MMYIITLIFMLISMRETVASGAGTTSLSFLKIDPGARPSAMAGAYSSYGDDSFIIFYNPGAASLVPHSRIDIMHYEYFEDLNFENISSLVRIKDYYTVGLGISYFYSGPIVRTVRDDNLEGYSSSGHYSTSDLMALLCQSFRLSRNIHAGINMKYLREVLDVEKATSFAMDLGFLAQLTLPLKPRLSLSVLNLGLPVRFIEKKERLPLLIRTGISFGLSPFRLNSKDSREDLNFAVDMEKPMDDRANLRFGAEAWFLDMISVRLGYRLNLNPDDLGSLALGAGLLIGPFDLNYAFVPYKYFENTHRFSLGVRF